MQVFPCSVPSPGHYYSVYDFLSTWTQPLPSNLDGTNGLPAFHFSCLSYVVCRFTSQALVMYKASATRGKYTLLSRMDNVTTNYFDAQTASYTLYLYVSMNRHTQLNTSTTCPNVPFHLQTASSRLSTHNRIMASVCATCREIVQGLRSLWSPMQQLGPNQQTGLQLAGNIPW